MKHTLDAKDKILGRIASEAALLLRGKTDPKFDPARFSPHDVTVHNTDYLRVTGKKRDRKTYYRHSGYIGKLKRETLAELMVRDSGLAVRRAVRGMLPKNRLRDRLLSHLRTEKGALLDDSSA